MAEPMIQWFGSGLGQNGSTSNMGAIGPSLVSETFSWVLPLLHDASVTATRVVPATDNRVPARGDRRSLFMSASQQGYQTQYNEPEFSKTGGNGRLTVIGLRMIRGTATCED
jgi:hypothetical protein